MGVALLAANSDQPAASELLGDGLAQLEQGQLDQAQATLQRIDPIELDQQQRQRLQDALKQVRTKRREMAAEEAAKEKAEQEKEQEESPEPEQPDEPDQPEQMEQPEEQADEPSEQADQAGDSEQQMAEKPDAASEEEAMEEQPQEDETADADSESEAEPQPDDKQMAADDQPEEAEQPEDAEQPEPAMADEQQADQQEPDQEGLMQQALTLRAQELTAQADQAAEQGEYNRAAQLYQQALSIAPESKEAKEGLETVRALLGRQQDEDTELLGQYSELVELRREQVKAEFDNAIEQARRMREQGNYDAAMDAATLAQSKVRTNQQYLGQAEFQQMQKQAQQLADQVAQQRRQAEARREARASDRVEREQAMRRQQETEQRRRKVQSLLRRVRDLQREMKYEQALEVLDQLLFLDPNNIAGQALKKVIEDSIIARNTREVRRDRKLEAARQSVDNLKAAVPHTELIQYPADWPQLTEMRRDATSQGGAQAEENQEVREALEEPIPISFQETPFTDVIDYLRQTAGVDIVVNWRALEGAGLDQNTPVSLQVDNVSAERAIELVLDNAAGDLVPLSYAIQDGVVSISTEENLAQNTQIVTYDIRDLVVQAPNFTQAPEFDLEQITQGSGGGGSGTGGGGSSQGLFDDDGQEDDEEDIFGLGGRSAAMMQQIMQLIRNTVSPDSWRANGGLVSSMSELNGSLIVNTTNRGHRQVKNLLEQLRQTRALQINVEARFLLVEQNFLEEVGVDLDATIDGLGDNFGAVEINQETISIADRQNTGVTGSFGATGGSTGVIDVQGDDDDDDDDNGGNGGNGGNGEDGSEAGTVARGITISGSFLSDVQVDLLIRATQANRRATQLTAPRLTFSNGQRAYVLVATQLAFITDLEPVVGTNAVGFDPEIGIVSSGVMLDVQGTVSADRRYVTLTARPSLARINRLRQIGIGLAAGGAGNNNQGGDGGTDGTVVESELEAPEIELTSVKTTVTVPDKGTILLGGQRILADVEVEAGVPVMSKIPVVNRLFTNRSTVKDERTLLILLKPSIIVQEEKEQELFPGIESGSSQPQSFGGLAPQ